MVTEQQQRTLSAIMPGNVLLLRRHTAWMTSDLMTQELLVLKQSLAPFMDTHQIFLTADAFRAHVTSEVWKQCVKQQILYCVIPAKLTWALQPCDTHVFASYKHRLQNCVPKCGCGLYDWQIEFGGAAPRCLSMYS